MKIHLFVTALLLAFIFWANHIGTQKQMKIDEIKDKQMIELNNIVNR